MGVHRQRSTECGCSGLDECAGFAFFAKAEILELNQDNRRKAVVDFGDVYVGGAQTGHLEGPASRLHGGRGRQTPRLADVFVAMPLAGTEHIDRIVWKIRCAIC